MKKIILSSMLLIAGFGFSQSPLGKGGKQLNAGVGLSSWGIPVYVGADFGVHEDITLGLELSYRQYHQNYLGYKYNHAIWGFSGNANYHFNSLLNIPQEWDFYAGLNVGFYHWTYESNYVGDRTSGLGLGGQIGVRYYFSEKFGLNLEGGSGNAFSGGKFGITIKF